MISSYIERAQRHEARAARFRALGNHHLAREREAKAQRLRARDEQERLIEDRLSAVERAIVALILQRLEADILDVLKAELIHQVSASWSERTGLTSS